MSHAERLLLGPGPSNPYPEVMEAFQRPVLGHLDPDFLSVLDEIADRLRLLFRTANALTLPISGTGSAGMEACFVNLLEPGDTAVIGVNGVFGERMCEVARRCGAEVVRVDEPWGRAIDPQRLLETQAAHPHARVLAVVHAETSTGVENIVAPLAALQQTDTLLLVDTVTSLGGIPVEVDAWGIDAVYSGTQKCLSCPPGLAPVSFSSRAVESINRRRTKVQSWYLDMTMVQRYWGEERFYHHTAPISMIYALREALRLIDEEGLEPRWARHLRNHQALKAGLSALGISYAAAEGHQLPTLNAVHIPASIDDLSVRRRLLTNFGIEIGGGLGDFKGKAWRIGLMGFSSRPNNVLLLLAALEQCLMAQGAKIEPGAGVAAANRVYR